MTQNRRVFWGEGMLLTPQHFQAWDRHRDALERERSRTLNPLDWGIRECRLDPEALLGGEVRVVSCAGSMPDGCVFSAPDRDPVPRGRGFAELFAPAAERLAVYLAIPLERTGQMQIAEPDAEGSALASRWIQSETVFDEVTGTERTVRTTVAHLEIRFEGERLDDYQTLKIAELLRTDTGGFRIDEVYLPPMTQISASPYLMQALRGFVDMLAAKSEDLAGQQRKTGGLAEAAGFWLLHTVNSHLPALVHYYHRERVHPEQLYLALVGLAGQLCTFANSESPRTLPRYEHSDLRGTFRNTVERLRELLGTVVPVRCLPIPLERVGETIFSAQIHDAALLADAQLYIGVAADVPEERILQEIPMKAKISSKDRVQQLLMMAVPGLGLRHVATPPQELPVQAGRTYFQLEKSGEHWDAIVQSQSLTFHLPPDFAGLRLELMAIKE